MPKISKTLSEKQIQSIVTKAIDGTYAIGGVEGLCIRIRDNKCKFVLRYTLDGTRHVLTLGDRSVLSLSAARKIALEKKLLIVKNQDPVAIRKLERSSKQTQQPRKNKNFEFVAKQFIAERQKNGYWRYNRKNGALQSMRLLERYAFPKIGQLSVNSLTSEIIWDFIKPIWTTKTNTAQKLLTLVRQICNWAIAHNIRRFKDNPADLKTSLGVLLEPLKYARKPKQNHAAASVEDLPEIFSRLHKLHSVSAKAAEFAILTAARSSAVRFATWDEFDLGKGIWRIPLEHDKSKLQKRDRTIFLSKEAIALLKNLCRFPESPLVFNGYKNKPLADMTLLMVLRRLHKIRKKEDHIGWIDHAKTRLLGKECIITLHGTARATFKTWAKSDVFKNNRRFDQEAVELCLLHSKNDGYNGAYDRAFLSRERRFIMNEWAKYCFSKINR